MGRERMRLGEFLLGLEGLALLRNLMTGSDQDADARLEEVVRMAGELGEPPLALAVGAAETDVVSGYAVWSTSYDEQANPLIAIEEPAVRSLLEGLAPSMALDAACGTGRHAAWLASLGHAVVGVDLSPDMLRKAGDRVPGARLLGGDVRELPLATASVDVAVCSLALGHLPDLAPPLAELARVVRPGGRVVVSVLHPVGVLTGTQAAFQNPDGSFGFVREHLHLHGDWLAAFAAAGLEVRSCLEPAWEPEHLSLLQFASSIPDAARAAFVGLPAALIWELEPR